MRTNTVEDPNQDPNEYSEIEVSYCTPLTSIEENYVVEEYTIYPNPFSDEIFVEHLIGDEYLIMYDFLGRKIMEGTYSESIKTVETDSGIYYITILNKNHPTTYRLIKQ